MNCHDIEKLLISRKIQSEEAIEHISQCTDCQQAVEFDRWLQEAFDQELSVPSTVSIQTQTIIARYKPGRPYSLRPHRKLVWTACAAVLALGVFAVSYVEASSPKARLAALRKALYAGKDRMSIGLSMPFGQGRKATTLLYEGNSLVAFKDEPQPGSQKPGAELLPDGSGWLVRLKDLPSDIRKQIEDAFAANGNTHLLEKGSIVVKGFPSCPEAQAYLDSMGIDPHADFKLSLDAGSYSQIDFLNDEALLLTPKDQTNVRYALTFNPETNLPYMVTILGSIGDEWVTIESSTFEYKRREE
jgi:hypothetical protein